MAELSTEVSPVRTRRRERLTETGAVAVLRTDAPAVLPAVAEALLDGGITAIEITMTTPSAQSAIEAVKDVVVEEGIVGVGSVTGPQMTQDAIQAGAEFVVSPIFKSSIVNAAHEFDVPAVPGAFTPTEVQHAHESGADLVKVFPASTGGPNYIRALKAPLPHLDLMPTGGVSKENAGDWLQAGAEVVGVGSALLDGVNLQGDNYSSIARNARRLRENLDAARDGADE
jgi:2-dehydro-3-deoxyphosphogluconate aldolase/(4S)-4-hydroxy-2-oxoglutarate aldolase